MGQVQPAGQFPSSNIELQKTAMQHWDVPAPLISFLIFREHERTILTGASGPYRKHLKAVRFWYMVK